MLGVPRARHQHLEHQSRPLLRSHYRGMGAQKTRCKRTRGDLCRRQCSPLEKPTLPQRERNRGCNRRLPKHCGLEYTHSRPHPPRRTSPDQCRHGQQTAALNMKSFPPYLPRAQPESQRDFRQLAPVYGHCRFRSVIGERLPSPAHGRRAGDEGCLPGSRLPN